MNAAGRSGSAHPMHHAQLRRAWLLIGGCTAVFLAFMLLPGDQVGLPPSLNVAVHTLLETMSIIVSVLVFSIGWHTFSRERSSSVALMCSVFLAVAVLDFVHVLSFQGMPELITPSGGGKAIPSFLAARLLVGLALLAIALLPWERPATPAARYWLFAAGVLIALSVSYLSLFTPVLKDLMFVRGVGLTPLKVATEYVVVGLNLAAAAGFLIRARHPQPFPVVDLFTAACVAALSELCFTLYASTTDEFNLLGHLFKVYAYLLIYRALYVNLVTMPYSRLAKARDEILRLNATLEQRVVERTKQLEAANRELEQFSWSVAHDLRSPLSVIANYNTAFLRGAQSRMTVDDREALLRIDANVVRMKEMIDALLGLAQVSRSELKVEEVDLAYVSAQIAQELRQTSPDRKVDIDVQGPMRVCGDRRLLTIAMDNLIGNAWKFTSERDCALIAIGKEDSGDEAVFFVKDNGVGFDMAEADKLFAAFQRLHTSAEFAGHGIGLANVRKIIVRHGGRIWADSEPGRGTVFRFTLPAARN